MTAENKGTRRDRYEMMGNSVVVDERDLEAQRSGPRFGNVERSL